MADHPSNKVTQANVGDVLASHELTADQVRRCERITNAATLFARVILENAPDCADRSTALRCVREAKMWGNSAVAIESCGPDQE